MNHQTADPLADSTGSIASFGATQPFGRRRTKGARTDGFSLVEMVLALGVLAFAVVPIFALLPAGMTTFRKAIDASVTTQISQRMVNEAQQTDFNTFIATNPPIRYFDDQGEEITTATGTAGSAPAGAIYQVSVHVTSAPTLPGADNCNENLATVTVQIANNPGNCTLVVDPATSLWSTSGNPHIPMTSYSTVIAGNSAAVTN
jgi:uncharacterized protein (TIGR02598 family)